MLPNQVFSYIIMAQHKSIRKSKRFGSLSKLSQIRSTSGNGNSWLNSNVIHLHTNLHSILSHLITNGSLKIIYVHAYRNEKYCGWISNLASKLCTTGSLVWSLFIRISIMRLIPEVVLSNERIKKSRTSPIKLVNKKNVSGSACRLHSSSESVAST